MAVSSFSHATQTATVTTEHELDTVDAAGVYVLVVDTAAMVLGDFLELRLKTKAVHDGTSRLAYLASYAHVQGDPIKYSIPVPVDTEMVVTLKQTAGTSRDFPWNILSM